MELHLLHKGIFIHIADAKKLNYLILEIVDLTDFDVLLKTIVGTTTKNKHSR